VPETHADAVREAMHAAGAGNIGNYEFCSFSIKGICRFRPMDGSNPVKGEIGRTEMVHEERIEVVCDYEKLEKIMDAVKVAHPYEQIAFNVYPLI
jgi:hypothetical protein